MIIVAAFAAMMSLAATGIYACFDCDLLRFQESKIAAATDVETVFLGDSSLGYALDAREFSRLSGQKTANLALTGYNYGMPGAYVLLTEVLKRTRPKNVVIAISPQTFALSIDQLDGLPVRGLLQASRRNPVRLFTISPAISWQVLKILSKELFDKRFLLEGIDYASGRRPTPSEAFYQYDYLAPARSVLDVNSVIETWGSKVPNDYDVFFRKMAQLCREEKLNCLYVHGTLLDLIVGRNQAFIRELGERIQSSGLEMPRNLPIEIPPSAIGNTINHIRPELRQAYTSKFHDALVSRLR
jgi:hypothetical protein